MSSHPPRQDQRYQPGQAVWVHVTLEGGSRWSRGFIVGLIGMAMSFSGYGYTVRHETGDGREVEGNFTEEYIQPYLAQPPYAPYGGGPYGGNPNA